MDIETLLFPNPKCHSTSSFFETFTLHPGDSCFLNAGLLQLWKAGRLPLLQQAFGFLIGHVKFALDRCVWNGHSGQKINFIQSKMQSHFSSAFETFRFGGIRLFVRLQWSWRGSADFAPYNLCTFVIIFGNVKTRFLNYCCFVGFGRRTCASSSIPVTCPSNLPRACLFQK